MGTGREVGTRVIMRCADCDGRYYVALGGYVCESCGDSLAWSDVVLEADEREVVIHDSAAPHGAWAGYEVVAMDEGDER